MCGKSQRLSQGRGYGNQKHEARELRTLAGFDGLLFSYLTAHGSAPPRKTWIDQLDPHSWILAGENHRNSHRPQRRMRQRLSPKGMLTIFHHILDVVDAIGESIPHDVSRRRQGHHGLTPRRRKRGWHTEWS